MNTPTGTTTAGDSSDALRKRVVMPPPSSVHPSCFIIQRLLHKGGAILQRMQLSRKMTATTTVMAQGYYVFSTAGTYCMPLLVLVGVRDGCRPIDRGLYTL
jgi:hypothetical protein